MAKKLKLELDLAFDDESNEMRWFVYATTKDSFHRFDSTKGKTDRDAMANFVHAVNAASRVIQEESA